MRPSCLIGVCGRADVESDSPDIVLSVASAGTYRRCVDGRLCRQGVGAARPSAIRLIASRNRQDFPEAIAAVTAAEQRSIEARIRMDQARTAIDKARSAESQAAAQIREAARQEDGHKVEIERLELRRTGLAERAEQARTDLDEARAALSDAEALRIALPDETGTMRSADFVPRLLAQHSLAEIRSNGQPALASIPLSAFPTGRRSADCRHFCQATRPTRFGLRGAAKPKPIAGGSPRPRPCSTII